MAVYKRASRVGNESLIEGSGVASTPRGALADVAVGWPKRSGRGEGATSPGETVAQGSGPARGLTGEVVRDLGQALEVSARWRTLAERLGNPFVTPEWFIAWQRHYCELDTPFIVIVRDEAGVVRGVLPLVSRRLGPFRMLRFAGGALGDRFEPVAEPTEQRAVAAAAAGAIWARQRDWSAIVLDWVDQAADWLDELVGDPSLLLARMPFRTAPLPYLDLSELSWEEYLNSRSRNFRSQLGRRTRALEREHRVGFVQVCDRDEVATRMRTLFSLHEDRWRGRGVSSLAARRRQDVLSDFAERALEAGWLRLSFLEVDGSPVAGWYGWRIGDRYAYYQAGFDPAHSGSSVGFVLLARTVEEAFAEGAGEYDFLRGDEEYKRRFTETSRQGTTWVVAPRRAPARLAVAAAIGARAGLRRLPRPVLNAVRETAGRRR